MKPTDKQMQVGQAIYTKQVLSTYDLIVYVISNRYIWQCPTVLMQAHYNANISANHLDVGVGSGYLLDHCQFPRGNLRIALMDMNPNPLEFAARRLARFRPETYRQNILQAIPTRIEPFDSVGVNYLLHCLPGTIAEKASVFDHLRSLMNPGARLFGATLLQGGVARNGLARLLMSIYNRLGVFSNTQDSLEELRRALAGRFKNVKVEVAGCVALFSGNLTPESSEAGSLSPLEGRWRSSLHK